MQSLCIWISAALLGCLMLLLGRFWQAMQERVRLNRTKDRLPPAPKGYLLKVRAVLLRLLCWIFVGEIKVDGKENLDQMAGESSLIIAPNHTHIADGFVMPLLLERLNTRFMAAPTLMNSFGGLFGLIFGFFGAFVASRKAGIEVLNSGQALLIFPEGWAYLDGKMGPFKPGVVRITREFAGETGKRAYVIPVFMRFGRYPGSWIRKLPILMQLILMTALSPFYRSGVHVVIGKPIEGSELDREIGLPLALESLRKAILALDPALGE